ncbi:MAG: glycosyl hydrolase 108 family protein [Rikenellaceae bacterium]
MAKITRYALFNRSWEGGYVDHPADRGGATNKGVTLATLAHYRGESVTREQLRQLGDEEAAAILKSLYWDRCRADEIGDESVASIIVDWCFCSGAWGIKRVQRVLSVAEDGIVGAESLAAINGAAPRELFEALKIAREAHFRSIVAADPAQGVFLRGWLRRLEAIGYGGLTLNAYA